MKRPPRSHLFRLYVAKGMTVRQVADHYGVTYGVARRWLTYHGIELRRRGPERTRTNRGRKRGPKPSRPPNVATFRRRAQRMSLGELAAAYDRAPSTIHAWCERYGVPVPDGRRRPDKPSAAELEQMRTTDGMTLQQIGDRYGVSRQRVGQWIISAGVASDSAEDDDASELTD